MYKYYLLAECTSLEHNRGCFSERPGVTWTWRAFLPRAPAGAEAWVTSGEREREQPGTSPALPCRQLPAAQLDLWTGKGPSPQKLLRDPLRSALRKTLVSPSAKTVSGKVRGVSDCSPAEAGERGAVTGTGRPGPLGHRSAASAGLGSLVVSTSCSGFYSLGFVWKC